MGCRRLANSCHVTARFDVQNLLQVHGGSAAGSLLDSVTVASPLQLAVKHEDANHQSDRQHHQESNDGKAQHQDPVAKYLQSLASAPRTTGFLSDKPTDPLRKTVSLDSSHGRSGAGVVPHCATGIGMEHGLGSPLGSGSHGSAATGFSGLSARFGSLHVAAQSPLSGPDNVLHGGSLVATASGPLGACMSSPCFSDGSAEASMRGGVPRLASTPSFGSMPMLASVASPLMMATGSAAPLRPRRVTVVHHAPLTEDEDDLGPLGLPDAPAMKVDEAEILERCAGSFHAPSVLDELDAGGAPDFYPPILISYRLTGTL